MQQNTRAELKRSMIASDIAYYTEKKPIIKIFSKVSLNYHLS